MLGTWLSGYFILVANSWMQHPVGYKIVDGEAQLTSVWALLSNGFALRAYVHTMLAGLIFGSIVVLGVCCWHFLRGHDVDALPQGGEAGADRRGAGHAAAARRRQPLRRGGHERAEHEDRRLRGAVEHLPAVRLLALPDRRLHRRRPDAELLDHDPATPLVHGHRLVRRPGPGPQPAPGAGAAQVRPRQLHAECRVDLLVDAGDGLRGRADVPGRGSSGLGSTGSASSSARAGSCGRRSSRSRSRTSPRPPVGSSPRWDASPGSCRAC